MEPEKIDLLVRHGYVVTVDDQRRMFADGAVAIRGSRIVAVGRDEDVAPRYRATQTIDARGNLVLPGLIDGHNHIFSYLVGGHTDEKDIMTCLYKYFYPYEVHVTPEEARIGALGLFAEMIKGGTTCFNDPGGYQVDALAQAAVDAGIRGIVNRSTRDVAPAGKELPPGLFEDLETNVREGEAVVRRWNGAADDRIRAWFSLRYVFNISDQLATAIAAKAREHKVGLHVHVAAVKGENEAVQQIYGKRSLERYYDLGLFGPNLYCVHMGYPNQREVGWLKQHDVKVTHCPTAALKGAWGVFPNKMIPTMLREGITMSIGTDTNGAAGSLDMIRVMYATAIAHRDMFDDPTLIGPYRALELATRDGARACLWGDQIGSLEAGKKADLIIVDTESLEWTYPGRDMVRALVYGGHAGMVDTTIVDGRILMKGRELLTVDEDWLRHEVRKAGESWMRKADVGVRCDWPVIA